MLKLPVPEAEYENVVLKPSEYQKEMVASLAERAEAVRDRLVQPYEDNMLKITNDGRKLALDQRLINDMLPDEDNSKATTCVDKAFEIWEQTADKKSTQLIFCDLSTPKGDGTFNVYIAGAKRIDLDVLQYVPNIANEPKAMEVVAELIAKLPDREIDGNLSPELEAKVWEKRMPQLSEEEKLAVEFDRLWFDYDSILYNDSVCSMTENVEELVQEIKTDGTERISDILREIVAEGVVPEEVDRAKGLLDKLSECKPLAKVEENAINGMEEQNYNMIDNVLNNGAEKAKKEDDRKEMDKPRGRVSLKERLAEKKAIIAGNDKAAEKQENTKKNQREM